MTSGNSGVKRQARTRSLSRKRNRPSSICVVGASYSGLVLARTLHYLYPGKFDIRLLERRRVDNLCEINGSINFFWAKETLSTIGLGKVQRSLPAPDASEGRTDKNLLLTALASSLPRGSVVYGTRVVDVHKGSSGVNCCVVWERGTGDEAERESAEFDMVVAADGLTSTCRTLMMAMHDHASAGKPRPPCLLIGDAARPFGRELFCSFDRIRRGASDAMVESIEIGKALGEEGASAARLLGHTLEAWRWRYFRNTLVMAAVVVTCIFAFVAARTF